MNCILKTLITTLFITSCWVYPLFAQFGFPREGVKAGIANQLNYTHNSTAALTNGGLAHTWFEGDTAGVFRIYTRFVSPEGRLLPPNGAVILSTGRNHAMDPKVAATSDGDAVIVWRENTGGDNWNVRAQRLNANGEILWEEGGHIYHRVDNLRNFSGYFIPDYEGGGYLIISGTSMRNPSWAYSLDENGELRNGWPEEGLHRDSTSIFVIPSRGGGGWINFEDEQWNRFNPEGSLRWDEGFIPQPPEWEYAAGYGNFLSDGWNLFCFYQGYREDGEGVAFAVSVYDTAGEQAASEVIYHRQANNLCDASSDCFVAEDGRCYLLVNEYYLGGDFITPIEMPLIYCYNPFGDEPFPFGEDGIRLPPFEEGELMWGASLFRVGEMLVIADNGGDYIAPPCRVWTLNSDGEPVWEEQPRVFDQAAVLRHHGGQNTFFNGRQFWVQSGLGCFSYNAEGEVLTGEQPVWLFPEFRSYLGYIGGGMTDESDFQFLYYPEAGLFKQTIGMDGELEYPLHGEQIREAWPRIWNPNNEYGEISGHPWLWAETNSSSGKIIFF